MNIKRLIPALVVSGASLAAALPLAADAEPICPAGTDIAIVRISAILPRGSREGFNLAGSITWIGTAGTASWITSK